MSWRENLWNQLVAGWGKSFCRAEIGIAQVVFAENVSEVEETKNACQWIVVSGPRSAKSRSASGSTRFKSRSASGAHGNNSRCERAIACGNVRGFRRRWRRISVPTYIQENDRRMARLLFRPLPKFWADSLSSGVVSFVLVGKGREGSTERAV